MTADELVEKIKEDYPGMREYRLKEIAEEVLEEHREGKYEERKESWGQESKGKIHSIN